MLGKEFAAQLVWRTQSSFAAGGDDVTTRPGGFASALLLRDAVVVSYQSSCELE